MISSRASRRTQLAATLVVVLAGCSSYTPPAARAPVDKETRIGAPIESVWKAGLPPTYSPELFQRKTEAVFQHVYESYSGAGQGLYAGMGA